mgnify:CR=1 FL=1
MTPFQDANWYRHLEATTSKFPYIMDLGYKDKETQWLVESLRFPPVVPPNMNRLDPSECDADQPKKPHEIEPRFRGIKRFRRVIPRHDKTDIMFRAFVAVTLAADPLQ